MNSLRLIGVILLLAMFGASGAQKIFKMGDTQTKQFTNVFQIPYCIAKMLVFIAGIIEIASVTLIFVGEQRGDRNMSRKGVEGLIVFTILATLIFKIYPRFKMIQFFSNMSILGGLILFYECLM